MSRSPSRGDVPFSEACANGDRQLVIALTRGLALLECFRARRPLMTNQELAAATGLPRSSVSRLTHTLIKTGYLELDSRRTGYRLGAKVLSLGHAMLGGLDLRPLIRPYMKAIAEQANVQTVLATGEDARMMIVDVVVPRRLANVPLEAGAHVPIHTTAMGRAYYASVSPAEQRRIRQRLAVVERKEGSPVQQILQAALDDFRQYGYCISLTDWQRDLNGVAVPLYLRNFGRRMVLTCGAPKAVLPVRQIHSQLGPLLRQSGREIEQGFERWVGR